MAALLLLQEDNMYITDRLLFVLSGEQKQFTVTYTLDFYFKSILIQFYDQSLTINPLWLLWSTQNCTCQS